MASQSEERVLDENILVASESEECDLSESDEDNDSTAQGTFTTSCIHFIDIRESAISVITSELVRST